MSKYEVLGAHLRTQPAEVTELPLSFAQLERVLGFPLPPSARRLREWWANTYTCAYATCWLAAGWKVARVARNDELVVFRRQGGVEAAAPTRARRSEASEARRTSVKQEGAYAKLIHFFAGLPPQQTQVALTFSEFSAIIGRPLPPSALRETVWWANATDWPPGAMWVSAGWLLETVYLPAQIAVFRRKGLHPVHAIPKYVRRLLDGSLHGAHPNAHTLARWLRFCRQVGWYFEGTMLYEKGGDVEALTEEERMEVDEDYATCKRELMRYRQKGRLAGSSNSAT